jgi:spermidine/putrescine transport system substrate-binding protein
VAGEVALSHNHSGEIATARDELESVTYVVPRQGAVIWADNLVIPAGAAGAYAAHVFMNFILDAENGAGLTEYTLYSSPNLAAWAFLPPELQEEHRRAVAEDALGRFEFLRDVGPDRRKLDELWTRVRAGVGR